MSESVSRLAPPPFEPGPFEGFEVSDIFGTKGAGERLADLVGGLEGHSVIVVDGEWSTGKSVFVRQWAGLLRRRGHPVVFFDAFVHDHLDDAFFPLFGSLLGAASSPEGGVFDAFREKLVESATRVARAMPWVAADLALGAATGGLVRGSDVRTAIPEAGADGTVSGMIEARLKDVQDHLGCVEEFRNAIANAVDEASERDARSPLVFIVDELDRCRPEYALRLLERLKHVFAADGVCFVLVTHLGELARMAQHAYGIKHGDAYLQKFYHYRLNIDAILNENTESARKRYLDHLCTNADLFLDPSYHGRVVIDNLIRVSREVSLRDLERIVLNWTLVRRLFGSNLDFDSGEIRDWLGLGLGVMRHVAPELYGQAAAGALRWSDAERFLRLEQWEERDGELGERYWRQFTVDGIESLPQERRKNPEGVDEFVWPGRSRPAMLAEVCRTIDRVADWTSRG